jgi:membrane protease YdiL (CAAX protease family)
MAHTTVLRSTRVPFPPALLALAPLAVLVAAPGLRVLGPALGVLALIVAPLAEEFVLRRRLQEALLRRRHGAWFAIVAAGLLGVLLHLVAATPWYAAVASVLALVNGVIYARMRQWWPCVVLHLAFNALWIATTVP